MTTGVALLALMMFSLPSIGQTALNIQTHASFNEQLNTRLLHASLHPRQIPSSALKSKSFLYTFPSAEKLPLFCALEKKLNQACNIWIRIRLE
jgi:hypothetical protein